MLFFGFFSFSLFFFFFLSTFLNLSFSFFYSSLFFSLFFLTLLSFVFLLIRRSNIYETYVPHKTNTENPKFSYFAVFSAVSFFFSLFFLLTSFLKLGTSRPRKTTKTKIQNQKKTKTRTLEIGNEKRKREDLLLNTLIFFFLTQISRLSFSLFSFFGIKQKSCRTFVP